MKKIFLITLIFICINQCLIALDKVQFIKENFEEVCKISADKINSIKYSLDAKYLSFNYGVIKYENELCLITDFNDYWEQNVVFNFDGRIKKTSKQMETKTINRYYPYQNGVISIGDPFVERSKHGTIFNQNEFIYNYNIFEEKLKLFQKLGIKYSFEEYDMKEYLDKLQYYDNKVYYNDSERIIMLENGNKEIINFKNDSEDTNILGKINHFYVLVGYYNNTSLILYDDKNKKKLIFFVEDFEKTFDLQIRYFNAPVQYGLSFYIYNDELYCFITTMSNDLLVYKTSIDK